MTTQECQDKLDHYQRVKDRIKASMQREIDAIDAERRKLATEMHRISQTERTEVAK